MQAIKVVVVGDGTVGKTTFLISFTLNCFLTDYVPTTFDNFNAVYPFEGRNISLGLWDTAGQPDFEKLRPISYKAADVFLLFFSVVNPTSLENVKEKWVHEVREHGPEVPYFLVGTQVDQRDNDKVVKDLADKKLKPIAKKEGKTLAKEIGAVKYLECSAKSMDGYREMFDEVLRYVINEAKQGKKPGKQCWSIDCRQKLGAIQKVKCTGRCKEMYCPDCIEIWEDGSKLCPQCVIYEKQEREDKGKKQSATKKPRKPPAERIAEQMEKDRIKEEKLRKKAEKQMAKQQKEGGEGGATTDNIKAEASGEETSEEKKSNSE
eukprot:TRINITY_DN2608_c0_g1_i1.p1 TRINITY_DN2608_c0_g1~~TRINITY_DN2608_c0_g1_i1.p1  ORF type:complete len:320 (+),score=88.07 TRINITY_DN2608_c0_g1_i1:102-1061(+)